LTISTGIISTDFQQAIITTNDPNETMVESLENQANGIGLSESEPLSFPKNLILTIASCGDKDRDKRRIRRLHGILVSRPGKDYFSFKIFEDDHWYLLEFPNNCTKLNEVLIDELTRMLGSENIFVSQLAS